MDHSNSINGPSRRQGLPTEAIQSPPATSSSTPHEEGLGYSPESPYENGHSYSYEPSCDTGKATSDPLVQPSEFNEPVHFAAGSADASQLALPVLEESTYSSDESSDAPLTPTSPVDDPVLTPPRINSPIANESAHYAAGRENVSPTLLARYYPTTRQPIARRTYSQTSTTWGRLELSVHIRLYSDNIRLRVFEEMIEAEVVRRFQDRGAATQTARLGYGRGMEETLMEMGSIIGEGDTMDGIKREVEALQREMGIFHLVTSSTLFCDSVLVRRGNNINNRSL